MRKSLASVPTKALNFSRGTTKKVTITDTANLRFETSNVFSMVCRFYLFNASENVLPRIIHKGVHYNCIMGDPTNGMHGKLALEVAPNAGGGSEAVEYWDTAQLSYNTWYHNCMTFNDGTNLMYLDGLLMAIRVINNPSPYTSPLFTTSGQNLVIGNSSADNRNFPGMIADVSIYNVVLTPLEVTNLNAGVDIARGLIGRWRMNEGTGSSCNDSSGNGNHGTITAAEWVSL